MSDARWYEVIGVYAGRRDQERFAPNEDEAEREAQEIRALYIKRDNRQPYAIYIAPHYCDPDVLGVECICAQHLTIDAIRFSFNMLQQLTGRVG